MRKLFLLSIILLLSGCAIPVVDSNYYVHYRYTGGEAYYPYNYYYYPRSRNYVFTHTHYLGCGHRGWRTPEQQRRHQRYNRDHNNHQKPTRPQHREPYKPNKPRKCGAKPCERIQ